MADRNDAVDLTRRQFLAEVAVVGGAATMCPLLGGPALAQSRTRPASRPAATSLPKAFKGNVSNHEAMFYEKLPERIVRCDLCPRHCRVTDGQRGWCGVRKNRAGVYRTLVYGKIVSGHVDPIEKKPMYHYMPGTPALSVATAGCNFECKFCQNWEISQVRPEQIPAVDLPPARLVEIAKARKVPTLAFTYNEPIVFYEYMHDAAKRARAAGIGSVMISNGYIEAKPLRQVCRHLTGVKVDFKAFSEAFYRDICQGKLKEVLETLLLIKKIGIHLELVVLVIPTLNDSEKELTGMAKWIVKNLGPDVPLHFSRFTPRYRLKNLPRTPVKTLERARGIARAAGVHYVYIGNVPFHQAGHTYCHKCNTVLIRRVGYLVRQNLITKKGTCPKCGTAIPGVWSAKQALAVRKG